MLPDTSLALIVETIRQELQSPRKRYLSVTEAGLYMGVSKTTLYEMMRAGELPFGYFVSGQRKIDIHDIDELFEKYKSQAKSRRGRRTSK